MKLTILAPALALCGGIALAQNPGTAAPRAQDPNKKMTDQKRAGDHQLSAEVVSTDATAQRITVRKLSTSSVSTDTQDSMRTRTLPADESSTFTLKVEGKALTRLSSVKAGDMVTISCRSLSAQPDTGAGAMGGSITSQAQADMHCASVTDISASKTR